MDGFNASLVSNKVNQLSECPIAKGSSAAPRRTVGSGDQNDSNNFTQHLLKRMHLNRPNT